VADPEDILDDARTELTARGLPADAVCEALRAVRARWGGADCYILSIDRAARDQAAREALARGASIQEAAKQAGCSVSTVRRRASTWQ
jgi:hypothetical protein